MVYPSKRLKICPLSYLLEDIKSARSTDIFCNLFPVIQLITKNNYIFAIGTHRQEHFGPPGFYEKWISKYLEFDFFSLFRMQRSTFAKLYNLIAQIELKHFKRLGHTGGRAEVPLEKCLLSSMWYLAKGETIISVADRFDITLSTVHGSITKCLKYMHVLLQHVIKWPTEEERRFLANEFGSFAGFPDVIGAIDGCHIPMKVDQEQMDSYTNRKFFQSIILQGVCSSKKLFTNIFVGFPGSANDARVFKNSSLYQRVEQEGKNKLFGEKYHILGDSAYPLKTWCLTPFEDRGRLTRKEKNYNYKLSVTRVVIEQVFGILKSRWRILRYVNVNSISRAIQIIVVCCILHNFCLLNEDQYIIEEEEKEESRNNSSYVSQEATDVIAKNKRNEISNLLNNLI